MMSLTNVLGFEHMSKCGAIFSPKYLEQLTYCYNISGYE